MTSVRNIILAFTMVLYGTLACVRIEKVETATSTEDNPTTPRPIDPKSGLVLAEGMDLVATHCTPCHSSKLIAQNRADREGWVSMIRWMQETQNLWQLGEFEEPILDYLSTYYAPQETGRRKPLENIEWYELQPGDN